MSILSVGGLISGGLIAIATVLEPKIPDAISHRNCAEVSDPIFVENVFIGDRPEEIYAESLRSHIFKVSFGKYFGRGADYSHSVSGIPRRDNSFRTGIICVSRDQIPRIGIARSDKIAVHFDIVGRGNSGIRNNECRHQVAAGDGVCSSVGHQVDMNIGPQLSNGGIFRSADESRGRNPESVGKHGKRDCRQSQKRIGDFDPVAKEPRPEFGSFLVALLGMVGGIVCGGMSGRRRSVSGRVLQEGLGVVLIVLSVLGLLLRFDLWSLLRAS